MSEANTQIARWARNDTQAAGNIDVAGERSEPPGQVKEDRGVIRVLVLWEVPYTFPPLPATCS
jgi:hypothetical protein